MAYYIGIDIGGTFTDCAVLDDAGHIVAIAKSHTRRHDPDRGVIDALAAAARRMRLDPAQLLRECRFVIHGCTVATNAMVERKGVRTALLTTRGHEDAIFIGKASQKVAGRSEREMVHQSHLDKADPPIISRRHVIGIAERVDSHGEVVVALSESDLARAIEVLRAEGIESVAVSFLWSFLNVDHERRARERIERALPGVSVYVSHELAPVIGEYERTATTVVNAYVGPKLVGYLDRLGSRLAAGGYRYPLLLAHCMGGLTTLAEVRSRPLLTLDSGPVSGVLGARFFGDVYGEPNILCADMGGTTFDVALIEQGRYVLDEEPVIDQYACLIPKVAVESIGAGGGSIVWIDENGLLCVGPQSAGADPGPACYARGGEQPTITDANLVLGYISPDAFLGGEMKLDVAAARRSLDAVASRAGLERVQAAAGAFRIVNAHMADLMRRASIDRGRDPRDFVMFSYGGAASLHVAYLARELGIGRIYVPSFATVFSAIGMLTGGILHSAERSFSASFPMDPPAWRRLSSVFAELEAGLHELFAAEQIDRAERRFERFVQMKYRLQPRALSVPLQGAADHADGQERLIAAFEQRYSGLYGANAGYREAGVEIVKCRIEGAAPTVLPRLTPEAVSEARDASTARVVQRDVYLAEHGGFTAASIYDGGKLLPGMAFAGPGVIQRMGDTILVPSFAAARVDGYGNVVLTLQPH